MHQFVRRVEQLNAYISQMPCFYYSPNANASTKPENILFTETELGAHVLRMCPIQWQDQYNLNEKGMTPMDMRLLLTSLEAIERVCTYKKGKSESSKKSSHRARKVRNDLVLRPLSMAEEGLLQEALRPVQEAWGRVYHAQHT
jgi:hypothetical protein